MRVSRGEASLRRGHGSERNDPLKDGSRSQQPSEARMEAFDIDPKKGYMIEKDFLKLDLEKYNQAKQEVPHRIHCIGNPPFGRQSSTARKFIKKCSLFCDTISFILPKSFRKESYQKAFPLNFHLVKEYDLKKDSGKQLLRVY